MNSESEETCDSKRAKWRSADVKTTENVDFSTLLLPDRIQLGLKNCGFEKPSPVQLQAIPLGRCGIDLVVQAKSGTGKTCVMAVIALDSLVVDLPNTQVLILAPTREIASQICGVIQDLGYAFPDLTCETFIGGLPLRLDKTKLPYCQIVVGTPGRIKQLIDMELLQTDSVRLFVVDEADRLFDKQFKEDINWIFSSLPSRKQILALSATYPDELSKFLSLYMETPVYIRINSKDPALLGITQCFRSTPYHPMLQVTDNAKFDILLDILNSVTFSQCMIFCQRQTKAQDLADNLVLKGFPSLAICSALDQARRLEIINELKSFRCRVLVSTDLTARGIDAENVDLVINFEIPYEAETYLHRIGRAGRYGTRGMSISLVSDGDELKKLKSFQNKFLFKIYELPDPIPYNLWDKLVTLQAFVPERIGNGHVSSNFKGSVNALENSTPENKPHQSPSVNHSNTVPYDSERDAHGAVCCSNNTLEANGVGVPNGCVLSDNVEKTEVSETKQLSNENKIGEEREVSNQDNSSSADQEDYQKLSEVQNMIHENNCSAESKVEPSGGIEENISVKMLNKISIENGMLCVSENEIVDRVAVTTEENVVADTTEENVAADTTEEHVAADTTEGNVAADTAEGNVVADTAEGNVVADTAEGNVVADTAEENVVAGTAKENVVADMAEENVVADTAEYNTCCMKVGLCNPIDTDLRQEGDLNDDGDQLERDLAGNSDEFTKANSSGDMECKSEITDTQGEQAIQSKVASCSLFCKWEKYLNGKEENINFSNEDISDILVPLISSTKTEDSECNLSYSELVHSWKSHSECSVTDPIELCPKAPVSKITDIPVAQMEVLKKYIYHDKCKFFSSVRKIFEMESNPAGCERTGAEPSDDISTSEENSGLLPSSELLSDNDQVESKSASMPQNENVLCEIPDIEPENKLNKNSGVSDSVLTKAEGQACSEVNCLEQKDKNSVAECVNVYEEPSAVLPSTADSELHVEIDSTVNSRFLPFHTKSVHQIKEDLSDDKPNAMCNSSGNCLTEAVYDSVTCGIKHSKIVSMPPTQSPSLKEGSSMNRKGIGFVSNSNQKHVNNQGGKKKVRGKIKKHKKKCQENPLEPVQTSEQSIPGGMAEGNDLSFLAYQETETEQSRKNVTFNNVSVPHRASEQRRRADRKKKGNVALMGHEQRNEHDSPNTYKSEIGSATASYNPASFANSGMSDYCSPCVAFAPHNICCCRLPHAQQNNYFQSTVPFQSVNPYYHYQKFLEQWYYIQELTYSYHHH